MTAKVISCTGYGGTGSSAVTDLISEYDNVYVDPVSQDWEVGLFTDPDGILNLHHYLVDPPLPGAEGRVLLDFWKKCRRWARQGTTMNYEKYFHNNFMKATNLYLQELLGDDYQVYYELKGEFFSNIAARIILKIYYVFYEKFLTKNPQEPFQGVPMIAKKLFDECKIPTREITEKEFTEITRKYLSRLIAGITDEEYLSLDHIISPFQIDECAKYFDDIYIVVADRDPRDVYLSSKHRWGGVLYRCQ